MAAEPMACPDMPEEPAVTVLDADGDLLLKVGTTKCTAMPTFARGPHFHDVAFTFRVCSRTLARASPVWKRMLFGGFAESKPNEGDWIVGLPDDSPEAMSTLLGILYAKFDGVPLLNHLITTKDLFNITVLTDKYDLTHILRPGNVELLWITWELDDQACFASTAKFLAQHMKSEKYLKDDLTPPEVTETVLKLHHDAIDRLIRPYGRLLSVLSGYPSDSTLFQDTIYTCSVRQALPGHEIGSGSTSKYFNEFMLEYYKRALSEAGLCPRLEGRSRPSSCTVLAIAADLRDIISNTPHLNGHARCRPIRNAIAKINAVVDGVVFTPTKLHIEHLQAQAIKSGLSRQ